MTENWFIHYILLIYDERSDSKPSFLDFTIFGFNLSNIFTNISMPTYNKLQQKSPKLSKYKNFSKNLNFDPIFTKFQFMTQLNHKN